MASLLNLLPWLLGVILAVAGCSFLLFTLYVHYMHVKFSHIPGPKRSSFFFGHLPQFKKAIQEKRLPDDLCFDWYQEHGKVFVFFLLHRPHVHVYTPEAVREILVQKNFPKEPYSYSRLSGLFGQKFMGRSLLTEIDNDTWRPLSDLFSPTFHRNFLKTCTAQFNKSCDLLLEEVGKMADGQTEIQMLDMFNRVSLDCICKVAFGLDLNVFTKDESRFIGDIKLVLDSIFQSFINPLLWCNPLASAKAFREQACSSAAYIRKIGRDCILAKLEALERGEPLEHNILSHILQTSTGGSGLVNETELEDMVNHFVTFFVAGQETTACLMTSALLELGRHPDIAYKMRTEVDAVIGEDGNCSFEDLSSLKYTTAVLKEALRVHPPVAAIMRESTEDVVWNGIRIPKGCCVSVSIINMGRLEEYFENPGEFMPSRFMGDESYSYVHVPFSLGPRKCMGGVFAMIEARIIMAKLMKYFTFDLVPGQSFRYVKRVTTKPKDGLLVYAKPLGTRPTALA